jgi:hypothetical protein
MGEAEDDRRHIEGGLEELTPPLSGRASPSMPPTCPSIHDWCGAGLGVAGDTVKALPGPGGAAKAGMRVLAERLRAAV